jgi:hypothetical protein
MGTQTGPNRLVGNADYPNAGAYASVRRADTRRVEQPQTHPGLIRTWCSVVHAITHSAPTGRLLNESQACARAYSDGPAFDLPQDSPRIAPETPFARIRGRSHFDSGAWSAFGCED